MNNTFLVDTESAVYQRISVVPYEKVNKNLLAIVQIACNNISQFFPTYKDLEILFVDEDVNYIAHFEKGTAYKDPIILLNISQLYGDLSLWVDVIHKNIYHEYGHALFECDRVLFSSVYLGGLYEELFVGGFANNFFNYREVPTEIKRLLSAL